MIIKTNELVDGLKNGLVYGNGSLAVEHIESSEILLATDRGFAISVLLQQIRQRDAEIQRLRG